MILKSVRLSNIRSYTEEFIEFPEGSVLLSGDIGSGKSTILLAIEFALFGVRRKHLSGESLLRHSAKEGFVELNFSIDGKEYTIKRFLKRGKEAIKQEAGYIIANGVKKEGTAVELKTAIIDILGYPKDLVTKTRDLVYRYTIFTPQEEMKHILTEEPDIRLDTLRRVFGIDKYKIIKENSNVLIKELKDKIKVNSAKIELLDEKKQHRKEVKAESEAILSKISGLMPFIDDIKKEIIAKKKELKDSEERIKRLNELKNDYEIKNNNLKMLSEQLKYNESEIRLLNKQVLQLDKELSAFKEISEEELSKGIKSKINESNLMDETLQEIRKKIHEFKAKIEHSRETKEKISRIDKCPVCEQDVEESHKHSIHEREDDKINKITEDLSIYYEREKEAGKMLKIINDELEKLKKLEGELRIRKIRLESLDEKLKSKANIDNAQNKLKEKIELTSLRINELKIEVSHASAVEKIYNTLRKELELVMEREKRLSIQLAELNKENENLNKQLMRLDEEIKDMEEIKNKSLKLKQMVVWVEDYFLNVVAAMEKQVMFSVHSQFSELFQDWFDMLIEDETISVKLDDNFSPLIIQNGYETYVENLSGGERTSCALAYRLALNKVVNNLIGNIKTKDLLILDEPTDGFSTEQLDKVRDVLDQINIKQIVIVSHESKIESFVDNVIRINKEEHVSRVLA